MGIKSLQRSFFHLIVSFILVPCALTFASDNNIVIVQGVVMGVDLKNNVIIVNEKTFHFNQQTAVYSDKGLPVTVDQLKPRTWIVLEGLFDRATKSGVAKKIHLAPKGPERKGSFSLVDK